jgi:uncharacterized protein (TIGR03118 family)
MGHRKLSSRLVVGTAGVALAIGAGVLSPAASAQASAPQAFNKYQQTNLVADQPGPAQIPDGDLLNAFGISSSSTSALWVSDNHSGLATTYSGGIDGSPVTKDQTTVTIPDGEPTGQVFNSTNDFALDTDNHNAVFIFANEHGEISGWNPHVDATHAVNKGGDPNAIYKGLTLASTPEGSRLYAANFSEARVDVFDGAFMPVSLAPGAFQDPDIRLGFAPFNVQALGDRIYVSFAKQDKAKEDEVDSPGAGYVDAFSTDGTLLQRFTPHHVLDAPWGMVIAPHDFGMFHDMLLVGNFGNGHIHAFDPATGKLLGSLHDVQGHQMTIRNLWALRVGNSNFGGTDAIVFSAGPGGEEHGLVGTLAPADS